MAEVNDFAAWSAEFGTKYSTYVSDDFLDLATILANDVVEAPPELREEKSAQAIEILDGQYAEEMHLRKLTVVAFRALTIDRIVLDNVLDRSDEFSPVIAQGTAFGFSYLRVAHSELEPIFGLQLIESTLLTSKMEPFAPISSPLLIPLQDLRHRTLH